MAKNRQNPLQNKKIAVPLQRKTDSGGANLK